MENEVVSLKAYHIEKQYIQFYSNLENYNRALAMTGSAPKDIVTFKQSKSS